MAALKNSIELNISDFDKNLQQAIAKSEEFQKGLEKLGNSKSFSKLGIDINKFNRDINGNAAAMSQFATDMSKNTNTVKQQIRQLQNAMANLVANGIDQASESYRKMQMELGRLMDIQSDVQAAGKNFADDYLAIQSVTQGFQAFTGVIGMGVSAMNLFGIENENTEAAMKKTLQITNLLNGAQAVSQVFNKDSAFMLKIIKPLREAYNNAIRQNTVATNINTTAEVTNKTITEAGTVATVASTVAEVANGSAVKKNTIFQQAWNVAKAVAQALLGNFTGLLLVGAGALATYAIATSDSTDEEKKSAESKNELRDSFNELKETVAASVGSVIGKYASLQAAWKACRTEHQKNEFINKNKNAWSEFGWEIDNTKKAEDFYVNNTTKVCDALQKRAEQMALMTTLQKSYEKHFKKIAEFDSVVGGKYYTKSNYKAGDKISADEARKYGIKGYADRDPIYGVGDGNIVLDEAGAEMLNIKKDAENNAKAIEKYNKNLELENKRFQRETQPIINRMKKVSSEIGSLDMSAYDAPKKVGSKTTPKSNKEDKKAEQKAVGEYEKAITSLKDENEKLYIVQQKLTKQGKATTEEFQKNANKIAENNEQIKEFENIIKKIKNPEFVDETSVKAQLQKLKDIRDKAYEDYMTAPAEQTELKFKVYLDANKAFDDFSEKLKNKTVYINVTSKADLDGNNLNINNLGLAEINEVGFDVGQKSIEETKNQISETINLINKYRTEINRVNDLKAKGQILSGTEAEQFSELETSVDSLTNKLGELIQKYNELISAQNQKNETIEKLDEVKTSYEGIAETIGSVSNVIGQVDSAWAQMTTTILNGIAQIIPQLVAEKGAQGSLAISKGVAAASGLTPPWNLIMIGTTVAAILAALATQPFAEGGIVGGTSFKGDKIYARLNSGEMVLNGRQQANLFNMINNGGLIGGGKVTFEIKGRELVGVLNNYNNKRNKVL